jgi:hypothetical protein
LGGIVVAEGGVAGADRRQMKSGFLYPTIAAAALALVVLTLPPGFKAGWLLVAQDDPTLIADRAVNEKLTADVARQEIEAALAVDDVDLASSFAELAREHGITLDRALTDKVEAANSTTASASRNASSFASGLLTGEPNDAAGLAGTAVGDLFVVGDIRDAVREGSHMANGEQADEMILGLACVGIAVTAGTYASLGIAAPVRVGLTLVKVARKTGRIGSRFAGWISRSLRATVDMSVARRALASASISEPALAVRGLREAVKMEKVRDLARVVGDVGRVEAKAGTQAALDSLKLAEGPRDMSRLARLAEVKGGKTRAIIKLAGGAAITLSTLSLAALDLFSWAFGLLLTLLGFAAALKRTAERVTLRAVRRRKARRARLRAFAMEQVEEGEIAPPHAQSSNTIAMRVA